MVSAFLISGILQGLFLILLLVQKEFNRVPNRILSALVLVVTAHLSLIAIDVNDLFVAYPHLSRLSWLLPLLYGPLILLLTESLVSVQFSFKPRHALYLIPFATYLIVLAPYYISSADFKIAYYPIRQKWQRLIWLDEPINKLFSHPFYRRRIACFLCRKAEALPVLFG